MLKSEAEQMVRRVLEEYPQVQFTDEQITVFSQIILRICDRMIEEALAAYTPKGGGRH
jgi:hypothetical protein